MPASSKKPNSLMLTGRCDAPPSDLSGAVEAGAASPASARQAGAAVDREGRFCAGSSLVSGPEASSGKGARRIAPNRMRLRRYFDDVPVFPAFGLEDLQ